MVVAKGLELTLGPGVQDPILNTVVGILSLVLGLVPGLLDLGDQGVLVCLSRVLDLDTLLLEVAAQLLSIPLLVGTDCIGFPILLDDLLEILAVCGSGIRDVVIGEPALELGLMPFVIRWDGC